MEDEFRPGQIVRCEDVPNIASNSHLTVGAYYVVSRISCQTVDCIALEGFDSHLAHLSFFKVRFRNVTKTVSKFTKALYGLGE